MKKSFLNKIRKQIEEEKTTILVALKQSAALDIDTDGDETDEIQAKILALASTQLMTRNKEKLSRLDVALKKISEGTFGYCEECEEEISEKRLTINPWFSTCISCAEHLELQKKQVRR
jgi:RNA polymerase-binding transcription factor